MARRQRKLTVLTEYWRYLTDTCLHLGAANKNVKRIYGHNFALIAEEAKREVIANYVKRKDILFFDEAVCLHEQPAGTRALYNLLLYQVQNRTQEQEFAKVHRIVQRALYLEAKPKLSIKKKKSGLPLKKSLNIKGESAEKLDETTLAIQKLIEAGHVVPFSAEYIPEFHEMAQLMAVALEVTKRKYRLHS